MSPASKEYQRRKVHPRIAREAGGGRYNDQTVVEAGGDALDLLTKLAVDWGMSWTSIARLCGASLSDVREWRCGKDLSPGNRLAVSHLFDFIDLLGELPIDEPASWLAMPLVSGYTVTPEDLYIKGHTDQLLDYASGQTDLYEILNEFDGNWRTSYRSPYEIVEAGDGHPSIVRRS